MRPLLKAELLKVRTTRTFVALAAVALATSLLIVVLTSLLSEPSKETVLTEVFTSDTSSLFIAILAIVGISGEWRHRTITSSLLAAPDRLRFLVAKTLAFAGAGLILSLVISVCIAVVGATILSSRDLPLPAFTDVLVQIGHNALLATLLGGFGVGIGALVRNQPAAIVGALLMGFVVEPALMALVPEVGRFGPFGALALAVQDIPADETGFDIALLSPGLATLALLGWIAAAFAPAYLLLRRRDIE